MKKFLDSDWLRAVQKKGNQNKKIFMCIINWKSYGFSRAILE
jgi:hypothetical protein